jgi:hypothetical protein
LSINELYFIQFLFLQNIRLELNIINIQEIRIHKKMPCSGKKCNMTVKRS